MSKKRRKNKTTSKSEKTKEVKKSTPLPPIELTLAEATLVYELMHDVKVTYLSMSEKEKTKQQVQSMVTLCNKIMNKVEKIVINNSTNSGDSSNE